MDTPTHFNFIVVGTELSQSVLAASLSKAGYSILQLDPSEYYGGADAALSLHELESVVGYNAGWRAAVHDEPRYEAARAVAGRFAVSLSTALLPARGPALEAIIRSNIASYMQFGRVDGIALWTPDGARRVPTSKADVFNDSTLSLIEKRRLTKFLLYVAGNDSFQDHEMLREDAETTTFTEFIKKAFSISESLIPIISYALALNTSPCEAALPALLRLRSLIHAANVFSPLPYIVGHYGFIGDLASAFSRTCAVWGGGQILGKRIYPVVIGPSTGTRVVPQTLGSIVNGTEKEGSGVALYPREHELPALGVPVELGELNDDANATGPAMLTADALITSGRYMELLFPGREVKGSGQTNELGNSEGPPSRGSSANHLLDVLPTPPSAIRGVLLTSRSIGFPDAPADEDETKETKPDSNILVFPPKLHDERVGTLTAVQVGADTFATSDGFYLVYLDAPVDSIVSHQEAEKLLKPYVDDLLLLYPDESVGEKPTLTENPGLGDQSDISSFDKTQSRDELENEVEQKPERKSPLIYSLYYAVSKDTPIRVVPPETSEADNDNKQSTGEPIPANAIIVDDGTETYLTSGVATRLDKACDTAKLAFEKLINETLGEESIEFFGGKSNTNQDEDFE